MLHSSQIRIPFQAPATPQFRLAQTIARTLHKAGHSAYLDGGAVRDMVLGHTPEDVDVTTSATPEEIGTLFEHTIPVGISFGVMIVVLEGYQFEVATYREERNYEDGRRPQTLLFSQTVQEDVIRRDFTFNALLYDVEKMEILDLTGGLSDLKKGVLRTIGDPMERFAEDYLRMLRAVRFTVRFGFTMAQEVKDAILILKEKVRFLSRERIRDELNKMLCGPDPHHAVELLSETGLLKEILPDVEAMKGVEQDARFHPEGDVFVHTMLMLSHLVKPSPALAWAVLLHDVGKKACRTETPEGISHFYGHEDRGSTMAEEILRDLKHPNDLIKKAVMAVRNHMRFAAVQKMRVAKLRRLMADDNFLLELELHRLDCIACHKFMENYIFLIDELTRLRNDKNERLPEPFLNGRDLQQNGIRPGPEMGRILQELADLQLEGKIRDKEEALHALKRVREKYEKEQ